MGKCLLESCAERNVSVGAREGVQPQSAFDFMFLKCTRKQNGLNKAEAIVLKDPLAEIPLTVLVCMACPVREAQTPNPFQLFGTVLECPSDMGLWEPRACPSLLLPQIWLCRVYAPAEGFLIFSTGPAHDTPLCSHLCMASLLALFLSPLIDSGYTLCYRGVFGVVHSCAWLTWSQHLRETTGVQWVG